MANRSLAGFGRRLFSGVPQTPSVASVVLIDSRVRRGFIECSIAPPELRVVPLGSVSLRVRILKPRRLGPPAPSIRGGGPILSLETRVVEHPAGITPPAIASPAVEVSSGTFRNVLPLVRVGAKELDAALTATPRSLRLGTPAISETSVQQDGRWSRPNAESRKGGKKAGRPSTDPGQTKATQDSGQTKAAQDIGLKDAIGFGALTGGAPESGLTNFAADSGLTGAEGDGGFDCPVYSVDLAAPLPSIENLDPGFPSIGRAHDGMYVISGLPVILRRTSRKRLSAKIVDAIDMAIPLRSGFDLHEVEILAVFTDLPMNRVMEMEMSEDMKTLQVHPAPRARAWGERQTLVFFKEIKTGEMHRIFV